MSEELIGELYLVASQAKSNSRRKLLERAADAIEELKTKLNHADEQIEKLVEAAEERRWIPVTERLPKGADKSGAICENVWLFFDDGGVYPGWMNGRTGKVFYLDNLNDVVMKAPISRVKMWQPRPEPPKEETE